MYARTTIFMGTALAILSLAAIDTATAQQAQFAGNWVLNAEKSDDAQEKMQQALRRSGPGDAERRLRGNRRDGQRGNPAGRRRGGGARPSRPTPEAQATNRVAQQRIMRAGRVMTIVIADSTVTIGLDDFLPWIFPTNDGKREFQEGVEVSGKWDGDKLVVQTTTDGGLKIRETYELKEDGAELQVSYEFENTRNNLRVRFKRVYNAQEAAPSDSRVHLAA